MTVTQPDPVSEALRQALAEKRRAEAQLRRLEKIEQAARLYCEVYPDAPCGQLRELLDDGLRTRRRP